MWKIAVKILDRERECVLPEDFFSYNDARDYTIHLSRLGIWIVEDSHLAVFYPPHSIRNFVVREIIAS